MRRFWWCLTMAAALAGCCRPQLEVVEDGAAVIVRGARAELRVEDGRITSLRGPDGMCATGDVRERCGRVGLGVMASAYETSYVHCPFVSPLIDKNRPDERKDSFRSPDARSVRTVTRADGGVVIRWQGLSNGKSFFPEDMLEVAFGTDANGAITMRTRGRSPKGGVFGIQMPIENLRDDGAFVLPFLSGMRFRIADMQKGVWSLYCDFIYCQAPVAAIETPRGSFGVWSEDDRFNQYQAYFPKGDRTAAFAWEWLTIMPFELQKEACSPLMKIDAFPGCDWLGAATPYRDWFRTRFAEDLAVRARNSNPDIAVSIRTWWDRGQDFDDHLDTLTNLFGKSVLFNYGKMTTESTLPPHRYDWGLPGHTPDTNRYAKAVAERQKRGITCACYSVAYCANYDSPAFRHDKVDEFALPTLNCAYQYRAMSKESVAAAVKDQLGADEAQALQTMNNTLRTVDTDVMPWDTPADKWRKMKFKDQELVYLDMNSKRWRDYIVGVHRKLFDALGLQSFYSDCLGVIRDTGNGVVDGTSGAMGSYLLAKELQKLGKPFSSECGSAPIAMFVDYPHASTDCMSGKPRFMAHRFRHSVPLCAYLFGYRPLCGGYEALRSDERNFVACACNDALGGMGGVSQPPWNTQCGISDHLVVRSLVFARKRLKPCFPADGRYPEGVTCLYRGVDGEYRYCGEGPVQVMYGPDGTPLWGRVFGATEFDVPGLELPGWPMRRGSRHYGLKPDNYYALFPVREGAKDPSDTYGTIGEDERIVLAYDTPEFAYLELAGKDPKVAFKVKSSKPEVSRIVSRQNGIERFGQERRLDAAPKLNLRDGIRLFRVEDPGAFRTIDFVHTVRKGEAVRLLAQNREWGTWDSDGCRVGIYVNGRRQVEYDTAPEKNPKWVYQHAKHYLYDYRMHRFTVPLDKWAGETVLVSVRIDSKNGTYDDRQDISLPEIVPYAGEPLDEIVKGMVPESAYQYFNGGEPPRE